MKMVDTIKEHELQKWSLADFQAGEELIGGKIHDRKIGIVCGCGRSGTTLTRVLLDSHSQVYAGLESLLFLPIPILASTLAKKFNLPEQEIALMLSEFENRGDFIEWFISRVLRQNEKTLFIDKTARNIHVLENIWQIYPNALVINILRDPVDNISSLRTHPKRMMEGGKIVETGIEHDVQSCIDRWKLATMEALKHAGNPKFRTIRYEDLVLRTEEIIRDVCVFLGVAFEPNMLEFTSHNSSHTREPVRGFIQNIEATMPISTESIGKGYSSLTPLEIAIIVEQTKEMFELLK